jgi:hypothetical protein
MEFTHKKKPYLAKAIQWNPESSEESTKEILGMLGSEASLHDNNYIMIRGGVTIKLVRNKDWVVQGENGIVKVYTPQQFHEKYEELNV